MFSKTKKEKIVLSPEEKKTKRIKTEYNLVKIILVISSIAVYIGFTLIWKEKWGNTVFFGGYSTLLLGIALFSYGILSHIYILHKFKVIPWLISLITCCAGVVLMAGTIPYIIGGIVILMLCLEVLFNLNVFKEFAEKYHNKFTKIKTNQEVI